MLVYVSPVQEPPFDQIPSEIFEWIGEFYVKICIDPGDPTMAAEIRNFQFVMKVTFQLKQKTPRDG